MTKEELAWMIICQRKRVAYISDIETYELKFLTPAAMEVCGVTSVDQYLNKKCFKLLQGLDAPCSFCTNSKLNLKDIYKWDYYNRHLGCWVSAEDSLISINGKEYRLETVQDVTKSKEEINQLASQLSKEEALNKCIEMLAYEEDLNKAIDSFLDTLGDFYKADRAYIIEYDFENSCANNTYEWCRNGITAEIDNLQDIPLSVLEDWEEKFKEDGWFYLDSVNKYYSTDSAEYRILNSQNIKSIAVVAFIQQNKTIGFIGVDNPSVNINDWSLLQSVSTFVIEEIKKRKLLCELLYASQRDLLTGLKNRNCYQNYFDELKENQPDSIGIIFLDINGLKMINDKYGHRLGDELIVNVASTIKKIFHDCVYRIGGDEFIILGPDCTEKDFITKVKELKKEFKNTETANVSIGYLWKNGEYLLENAIILADKLMYSEKRKYYKKKDKANL